MLKLVGRQLVVKSINNNMHRWGVVLYTSILVTINTQNPKYLKLP